MELKTIDELNEWWRDAEAADKALFAEQRTNVLMVSGQHYNTTNNRFWNRLKTTKQITNDQHVKITKNHVGKISSIYQNSILQSAPGTMIVPQDEKELSHQKLAEQHHSVKNWMDTKYQLKKQIRRWAKDYVDLGEVFVKAFWDPNIGEQIGWEQAVDEETGEPLFETNEETGEQILDAQGQPIPKKSEKAIMTGGNVFELIHGPDIRRDAGARTLDESGCLAVAKLEKVSDLKLKFPDEDLQEFIEESQKDTFRVFDGGSGDYKKLEGMCLVKEYYFRPCMEYPKGYYYITTDKGILASGELPFGIFPIHYATFEEDTTSPRGHSFIRMARPYNIEINRASSQAVQHQLTLGQDKIFYQAGSKPSSGAAKPGVRQETYIGNPPVVIPGRVGEQFFQYIDGQVTELYRICNVQEEMEEIKGDVDPNALLYKAARQKKRFALHTSKFETFLNEVYMTGLKIFKEYAPEQIVIPVIGKNEQVNLPEFKRTGDIGWFIKTEPASDDIETMLGKQMAVSQILQYVGQKLTPDDIGMVLRLSPYLNKEQMVIKLTQPYDNAVNTILALDRGEYPPTRKYDKHEYQIDALTTRTMKADFQYLSPQIQAGYDRKIQEHEQAIAQNQAEIRAAEAGFIPSGGYLVKCDFYVPDPKNPAGTKRVSLPSEAVDWLIKHLDSQGSSQQALSQVPQGSLSEISTMLQNIPMQGSQQGQQMPMQPPQQGMPMMQQ